MSGGKGIMWILMLVRQKRAALFELERVVQNNNEAKIDHNFVTFLLQSRNVLRDL